MESMADSPAKPSGPAVEPTLIVGDWNRPPSFKPWGASLALHVTVVSLLAVVNPGTRRPLPELLDLLEDSDHQLVYHKFEDTLPAVAPEETPPESSTESKAKFKAPQTIVASAPDPQSSRQMIWTPEPAPEITEDVPSPNLLVWTPPDVPPPRFELKEAESSRPDEEALQAEAAPEVDTVADAALDLESLQPIQRLRYQAEAAEQQRPSEQALEAAPAPELAATHESTLDLAELQEFDPLRFWTTELEREAPKEQALRAGPVPQVSGDASNGLNIQPLQPMAKLRFQMKASAAKGPVTEAVKPDQAPALADLVPAGPRGETGANAVLATVSASLAGIAPPLPSGGSAEGREGRPAGGGQPAPSRSAASDGASGAAGMEGRKLAVVGVNPSATGKVPLGRRRGSFSTSPDGGPGGEGISGTLGNESDVRIPNLSISGARRAPVASLARTPSGSGSPGRFDRDAFLAKLRNRPLHDARFDTFRAEPTPENPEAGFAGRRVHTLAINMPNINSSSGSWVVRFSEIENQKLKGELLAPAPRVKVDPKYSRAAISERIEGEVILSAMIRNDGAVDHIKLIKAVDQRLDEAAIAALGKWKFHPALKGGVPVDVEVVVRIPFRLRPLDDQ